MVFLETKRLVIKSLTSACFSDFSECLSEPGILRDSFGQFSAQQIKDSFDWNVNHWKQHGFGQGIAYLKDSNEIVGIYGIKYVLIEGQNYLDPGALTRQKFQRQGFAREAMIAVINYGFRELGFEKITTVPSAKNKISTEIVEKSGFQFVRTVKRVAAGVSLENERLYELTKADWERLIGSSLA